MTAVSKEKASGNCISCAKKSRGETSFDIDSLFKRGNEIGFQQVPLYSETCLKRDANFDGLLNFLLMLQCSYPCALLLLNETLFETQVMGT